MFPSTLIQEVVMKTVRGIKGFGKGAVILLFRIPEGGVEEKGKKT